jgi:hypothetical protein
MRSGGASLAILSGPTKTATNAGDLLLICCRSNKRLGVASINGCSPPRLLGVRPTSIQSLPGCLVVIGDTAERRARSGPCSTAPVQPDSVSGFDLDGPLPEIPDSNATKRDRERVIERPRRDNLAVRQLAQIADSYGGLALALPRPENRFFSKPKG